MSDALQAKRKRREEGEMNEYLLSHGLHMSQAFLDEMASLSNEQAMQKAVQSDLRKTGAGFLLELMQQCASTSTAGRSSLLQGKHALMIMDARDTLMSKAEEAERSVEGVENSKKSKRLLKLLLTDGHSTLTAVEHKNCPTLDFAMFGSKIVLENVKILDGVAVLNPKNCRTCLGGSVLELQVGHDQRMKQLAHKLSGSYEPLDIPGATAANGNAAGGSTTAHPAAGAPSAPPTGPVSANNSVAPTAITHQHQPSMVSGGASLHTSNHPVVHQNHHVPPLQVGSTGSSTAGPQVTGVRPATRTLFVPPSASANNGSSIQPPQPQQQLVAADVEGVEPQRDAQAHNNATANLGESVVAPSSYQKGTIRDLFSSSRSRQQDVKIEMEEVVVESGGLKGLFYDLDERYYLVLSVRDSSGTPCLMTLSHEVCFSTLFQECPPADFRKIHYDNPEQFATIWGELWGWFADEVDSCILVVQPTTFPNYQPFSSAAETIEKALPLVENQNDELNGRLPSIVEIVSATIGEYTILDSKTVQFEE